MGLRETLLSKLSAVILDLDLGTSRLLLQNDPVRAVNAVLRLTGHPMIPDDSEPALSRALRDLEGEQ